MSYINVFSEIGQLKRVMLHRPSYELQNLTPNRMAQLLFDDVPFLKNAQREHDFFAETLRNQDVEVVYLEHFLKDVLINDETRKKFIDDFVDTNEIFSKEVSDALKHHYNTFNVDDLINAVFSGVRREDVEVKLFRLPDLIHKEESIFWVNPLPNLYFTRDPGASIGNGINIHYMRKQARRVETLFLHYIHKHHKNFKNVPLWYDRTIKYPIEGGDILVLSPKVLAVGYSERTSAKGIEVWAKHVLSAPETSFKKVIVLPIPKIRAFMHLDTVFTMVDYDKFTIHPSATGSLAIYELTMNSKKTDLSISSTNETLHTVLARVLNLPAVKLLKCGGGRDVIAIDREQWNDGSNTLAIAPGTVIAYDRNEITNEVLVNNGIKVLEIPSAELSRGRGGPRCMSMPLFRESI